MSETQQGSGQPVVHTLIGRAADARTAWVFLGALFLARLLWLVWTDIPPVGDEAYYWDWGRQPAWGYYSKPPMIGWIMAVVEMLPGSAALGMRVTALVLATLTAAVVYVLVSDMFGRRVGWYAMIFGALCPAGFGLSVFLTIDAPLMFFWAVALLSFWKAMRPRSGFGWWLLLGLALVGGVWSKQMMLVFPLLMFVHGALFNRGVFGRAGLWMVMACVVAAMVPLIEWNLRHDWITARHTAEHFAAAPPSLMKRAGWLLEFTAAQAGLYTPTVWAVLLAAMLLPLWLRTSAAARYLALFSLPALAVFHLLALRQGINPNWPGVFLVGGFGLAAAAMTGALAGTPRWITRLRAPTIWLLVVCTAVLALAPVGIRIAGWQGDPKRDPLARLRGWRELADETALFLENLPRPDQTFIVVLGHRYHASQMAFHLPGNPRVFRWERTGEIRSQYEIWPGPEDRVGWDAVVLYPSASHAPPSALRRAFAGFDKLGEAGVRTEGNERHFQVWFGEDLQNWPDPAGAR